ncbi:MAG: metal-sensitive transcriptional regulator [Microgenomates group bacterium]|nr:metal-sensitive transcriptional regulator [Microgenomates group bacterium]
MKHNRTDVLIALKKAKSLLEKIISMAEADAYCIDIMQQNLAVIGLLRSAHQKLMEDHLQSCFSDAIGSKNKLKKKKMINEILKVTKLYNK